MLESCSFSQDIIDEPSTILTTPDSLAFATYLTAAQNFYSGHLDSARAGFPSLAQASVPWLKEAGLHMLARTQLNAFDEYGYRLPARVDQARLAEARKGLDRYLQAYPDGLYAASARGLVRRATWLEDDLSHLANDYSVQFSLAPGQRSQPLERMLDKVELEPARV
ncbi:hypothetical protein HKW97_24405 (plasmid) [Pseudomonas luteola]|uniref:hypothetical protein n=1 Tax=Pseudomonas luteola TaxID=47886 RepID=UPI00388E5B4E